MPSVDYWTMAERHRRRRNRGWSTIAVISALGLLMAAMEFFN